MDDLIMKLRSHNGDEFTPAITAEHVTAVYEQLAVYFRDLFEDEPFRFELPAEFARFLERFGTGYVHLSRPSGGFLWDWKYVIDETKLYTGVDFHEDKSVGRAWLVVGEYSDKHWYFVCCNPDSPYFGKVADGEDTTPWNNFDDLYIVADDYHEFLEKVALK